MLSRLQRGITPAFFRHYHNKSALAQISLNAFFKDTHRFRDSKYTMQYYINSILNPGRRIYLHYSAEKLITLPLKNDISDDVKDIPEEFNQLSEKIKFFINVVIDILNNELAQRNYEAGVLDQENVSEREHGLQAGKIVFLLGSPLDHVLAMLLHDISRPSILSEVHSHVHHHKEGHIILAPLGLSIDYTLHHGVAKYFLKKMCPLYGKLISSVSQQSLAMQEKMLEEQFRILEKMDPDSRAAFVYKIMFMRLIDDFSKVPTLTLKTKPEYFNDNFIEQMIQTQISRHLNKLLVHNNNPEQTVTEYERKLDEALDLMIRAKEYSHHPELYQQHQPMLRS
jgi:predicted HD phosphohydrolase